MGVLGIWLEVNIEVGLVEGLGLWFMILLMVFISFLGLVNLRRMFV